MGSAHTAMFRVTFFACSICAFSSRASRSCSAKVFPLTYKLHVDHAPTDYLCGVGKGRDENNARMLG